jgi:hypothetical protein
MKLRSNTRTLAFAGAVALGPAAAYAQTGQFFIVDSATDLGLTLIVSINFTGGVDPASVCGTDQACIDRQSNVFLDLHASAIATATCLPPGQGGGSGKDQVTLPTPIAVAVNAVLGRIPLPTPPGEVFGLSITTPPPSPLTIAGAPDCRNRNWSEMITDLAFTNAVLTLTQGTPVIASGQLVCSFNPPTTNGTPESCMTQ